MIYLCLKLTLVDWTKQILHYFKVFYKPTNQSIYGENNQKIKTIMKMIIGLIPVKKSSK